RAGFCHCRHRWHPTGAGEPARADIGANVWRRDREALGSTGAGQNAKRRAANGIRHPAPGTDSARLLRQHRRLITTSAETGFHFRQDASQPNGKTVKRLCPCFVQRVVLARLLRSQSSKSLVSYRLSAIPSRGPGGANAGQSSSYVLTSSKVAHAFSNAAML